MADVLSAARARYSGVARSLVVSLLLLPVVAAAGAHTARAETDPLRDEIRELRRVVEGLATRVENLERRSGGQPAPAAAPKAAAAPETAPARDAAAATPIPPAVGHDVSVQEHWQRLAQGMPFAEVEALLGRPQRTVDMSPRTIWYYSYPGIGNGSVVFVQDGGVIDWQSPPFATWW